MTLQKTAIKLAMVNNYQSSRNQLELNRSYYIILTKYSAHNYSKHTIVKVVYEKNISKISLKIAHILCGRTKSHSQHNTKQLISNAEEVQGK